MTSRTQILRVAREIIDRDGWETLTLRRLATELGVGTTTLYHHISSREDLVILLLDEHIEQTLGSVALPDEPRDAIVTAVLAIHDALAAWPWTTEVLTVDGLLGRLGKPALRLVESIVAGAVARGCTTAQAVDLFRHLWYYTAGELLVRARSRYAPDDVAGRADRFAEAFNDHELPYLTAIGGRWAELEARDTFRAGLEAIVDGLLAQASAVDVDVDVEEPSSPS